VVGGRKSSPQACASRRIVAVLQGQRRPWRRETAASHCDVIGPTRSEWAFPGFVAVAASVILVCAARAVMRKSCPNSRQAPV